MRRLLEGIPGHPGNFIIVGLLVLGWFASGDWVGVAVMAAIFGPMYLYGAWSRG